MKDAQIFINKGNYYQLMDGAELFIKTGEFYRLVNIIDVLILEIVMLKGNTLTKKDIFLEMFDKIEDINLESGKFDEENKIMYI